MRKTLYIPILILFVVTFSCKTNSDGYGKLNQFLQKSISESDAIVTIDLTKYHSDLISHIESQIDFDLCDKGYFTGNITVASKQIKFPSYITKECETWNSPHKVITILVNNDNQALVDSEFVSSERSIQTKITGISEKWIEHERLPIRILYLFSWNTHTNPEKLKERTIQLLYGVKDFYSLIANKEFNKNYNELNDKELEQIHSDYRFKVGFSGYEYPIAPPPPPPTKLENIKKENAE